MNLFLLFPSQLEKKSRNLPKRKKKKKMKDPLFRSESLLSIIWYVRWRATSPALIGSILFHIPFLPFFSNTETECFWSISLSLSFLGAIFLYWRTYPNIMLSLFFFRLFTLPSSVKEAEPCSRGFLSLKLFPAFIRFLFLMLRDLGWWLTPVMATCRNLKSFKCAAATRGKKGTKNKKGEKKVRRLKISPILPMDMACRSRKKLTLFVCFDQKENCTVIHHDGKISNIHVVSLANAHSLPHQYYKKRE